MSGDADGQNGAWREFYRSLRLPVRRPGLGHDAHHPSITLFGRATRWSRVICRSAARAPSS